LRTVDSTPGNLRPAVTSFIGRESDIAEVQAALRTHRLVTLTGRKCWTSATPSQASPSLASGPC
jgi:hypothetical protein